VVSLGVICNSLLINVFKEIQKNEIENLIIDVRANPGGNGNLVGTLVNYLTDEPYVATSGSQVKTSEATKLCYTTHPVLVNAIEQARKAEGDKADFLKLVDCFLEAEPGTITTFPKEITTPEENQYRFNGQLYVLTSKQTFSSGTLFSAVIKDNSIGYIVGEETSDDPTGYACIMLFELPNTKINIQNSTQYSLRPAGFDDQRGVIPDFKVVPTHDDYINNFDRVLNYTYWLIDEKIED
jgi:C-terminal processing protease CtpA/Prc